MIYIQVEPKLLSALIASAAAVTIMVFTAAKVWIRGAHGRGAANSEVPDVKASLLRLISTGIVGFFALALVTIGIAAWIGKASVTDVWQTLEKAALAEALVLAYSGIVKDKKTS